MPPKRRLKQEPPEENSDASTVSSSSPSPPEHQYDVGLHAALFANLPTESVLAQVVGVTARLNARITALAYSSVTGDARVYRDCIRVTRSSLSLLRPAICDLAALEVVLLDTLDGLVARLNDISRPVRRRLRS